MKIKLHDFYVTINFQEGVDVTKQKVNGTLVINKDDKEVVFTQNPTRVKTTGKNPILFSGNYMNTRLHTSTGATQLTMRLAANTKIAEIREELIKEFVAAIDGWNG